MLSGSTCKDNSKAELGDMECWVWVALQFYKKLSRKSNMNEVLKGGSEQRPESMGRGGRWGHMALQVPVATKTPCSEKSLKNDVDSQGSDESEADWQGQREKKDVGFFFNEMWIH